MKKLLFCIILFYSINAYNQKIIVSNLNNTIVEFSTDKIFIKSKGYSDLIYNIISKSTEDNFDIYQLSYNTKIIHAKNFPTYNSGYIELEFYNYVTKKNDTITFIYNKNK